MGLSVLRSLILSTCACWAAAGLCLAADVDQPCKVLFQKKAYAAAGACFGSRVPKAAAGLSPRQTIIAGRRMRNGSLSYQRAASATNDPSKRAYYQEQAVALLRRYLHGKFYESSHRKTSAIVRLHTLKEGLRYAPLTVVTRHPKAAIAIRGFRFQVRAKGRWSGSLRPGLYDISVAYPGQTPSVKRQVRMVAERPQVVAIQPRPTKPVRPVVKPLPAPARPQLMTAGWTLLGIGAAVLIGAGITLGAGYAKADEVRSLDQRPGQSVEKSETLNALLWESRALVSTSVVCWSVGGAAALSGGLLLLLSRGAAPNTPSKAATRAAPQRHAWWMGDVL